MTVWEEKLLGEMVGLARATEGNEHLITESVTETIAGILLANVSEQAQYASCSAKIEAAKREMVPDCFFCANPCGRTAALDFKALDGESRQIRETKFAILDELRTIAGNQRCLETDARLYRGLVLLGLEDYAPEELKALFWE